MVPVFQRLRDPATNTYGGSLNLLLLLTVVAATLFANFRATYRRMLADQARDRAGDYGGGGGGAPDADATVVAVAVDHDYGAHAVRVGRDDADFTQRAPLRGNLVGRQRLQPLGSKSHSAH